MSGNSTSMEFELQQPASNPPPGVTRHMSTHQREQAGAYVCTVMVALVPGTLLALRLYTKTRIVHRLDLTDCLTVSAYLNLMAMVAIGLVAMKTGAGAHQWDLTHAQLNKITHWVWLEEILYGPSISMIKTAILLQYQRIFAPRKSIDRIMFYSSWVLIVLIILWNLISTIIAIFACSPREKFWNSLITYGHCLDYDTDVMLTAIFNILTDILILFLPTRAVWKLQLPTKKKLGIVSIFAIGLLACIANAMIIMYTIRGSEANADFSYNFAWVGLWAFAENGLGIIVICAFTLPSFIEARGKKVRFFLSSLKRPFTSYGSSLLSHRRTNGSGLRREDSDVENLSILAQNGRVIEHPVRVDDSSKDLALPAKAQIARSW